MKKKIAIILGSKSDLIWPAGQCFGGLLFLTDFPEIEVTVHIRSQHRNTLDLQQVLKELSDNKVDVIIAGAGWANHLTGCVDAFLRYELKNDFTRVIGVAFEDKNNERHTQAAILSITEVPGTQVIFRKEFIGDHGLYRACQLAVSPELDDLPAIKLPTAKPPEDLSLAEALALSREPK
ncbi:MAG: AIR carboxylase family protein [Patescibacteria group bacterium]|jgi:phosphoribosylcarboxyaminoimidazole (NCAIR) mutase